MKTYQTPDCRIITVENPDVVQTSGENETPKIDLLGDLELN